MKHRAKEKQIMSEVCQFLERYYTLRDPWDTSQFLKEVNLIRQYKDKLEWLWDGLSDAELDYRGGEETYGYKSIYSIQCYLSYISDRWCCAFRVKWLIDMINLSEEELLTLPRLTEDEIEENQKWQEYLEKT